MPAKRTKVVDREEYDALCEMRDLRDAELARTRLREKAAVENYHAALKVNEAQVTRLASQDLLLTELHVKIEACHREIVRLNGEIAALRAPVTKPAG